MNTLPSPVCDDCLDAALHVRGPPAVPEPLEHGGPQAPSAAWVAAASSSVKPADELVERDAALDLVTAAG